jgi:hypothetical protein
MTRGDHTNFEIFIDSMEMLQRFRGGEGMNAPAESGKPRLVCGAAVDELASRWYKWLVKLA